MPNWQKYPAVRLLLPLTAGIASCFWQPPASLPSSPALLWSLLLLPPWLLLVRRNRIPYGNRWLFGAWVHVFLFLLGYWLTARSDDRSHPDYVGRRYDREALLLVVAEQCQPGSAGKVRLTAKVLMAAAPEDVVGLSHATGRLLLYLPDDSGQGEPAVGDTLACRARFFQFRGAANPGGFDYRRYMHYQGIHLQGTVAAGQWATVGKASGWSPAALAAALQDDATRRLSRYLGEDTGNMAVGAALIIGNRDRLGAELKAAYSETGAMHVLAVSGLHVGIVFLLLKNLVRLKRADRAVGRAGKVGVVLAGIWLYAMVTGGAPSVVRSALMFSMATVGDALYRRHLFHNTLAAAAFLSLCLHPFWLATMSFQLSYLAVWGIVFFQPRLASCWRPRYRPIRYIWELTCVSMGAQLATLPLSLHHFGIFPVWFWLTSLVLVPLAGLELSLGLLLLPLDACWPGAAGWTGLVLDGLIGAGNRTVHAIREFPFAVIRRLWVSEWDTWLLYAALASIAWTLVTRRIASLLPALLLLATVCAGPAVRAVRQASIRQITLYNVSDGLAMDMLDGSRLLTVRGQAGLPALDSLLPGIRRGLRITRRQVLSWQDSSVFNADNCYRDGPWLQFGSVRLLVVDAQTAVLVPPPPGMSFTHCLVTGGALRDCEVLLSGFTGQLVIFGADNDPRLVRQWKKSCERRGLPWYDIREQGALILDAR